MERSTLWVRDERHPPRAWVRSGTRDQFDLEPVCVGQITGVVFIATGVGVPVSEEKCPSVPLGVSDELLTIGDGARVKGEVIQAGLQPVIGRPGESRRLLHNHVRVPEQPGSAMFP